MSVITILALLVSGNPVPVWAQSRGLALVRDAETENTIRMMAAPLFATAGLDPDAVRIVLVNDRSLNAFVAGGMNLFLHTGLLIRAEHAGQVMGVVAHETGHIAGGHLARLPEAYRNALITSLLAMVLGGAAAAASGQGQAVMGGMVAGTAMAQREFFAFTRSQENAADQAGISYMDAIGQSSRGLLEFMEILANQEFLSAARQDPYMRTHPLTQERVMFLRNHVAQSRFSTVPVPPDYNQAFRRVRAKLMAFLDPPAQAMRRYPDSDTSIEARYARAVAAYRVPDLPRALMEIDSLIKELPKDPYFHELRGQMLFENGRSADALVSYQRAVELLPSSALLRMDLAQVQLDRDDPKLLRPALAHLNEAARIEQGVPKLWRLMAIAYGRDGQIGMAAMALAEQAALEGRRRDARDQAKRALRLLPEGSPGWMRAQDIETQIMRRGEEDR